MWPALAAVVTWGVLAGAPNRAPPAQSANVLAQKQQWDELYLAFAAVKPDAYSKPERAKIAAALTRGCLALEKEDAALASSLGDKAAQLSPTAEGLLCLARTDAATDQPDAAEQVLRDGMKSFPKDAGFALALGKLLLEDKDASAALEVLAKVPSRAREAKEAQRLSARARTQLREESSARSTAEALEQRMNGAGPTPAAVRTPSRDVRRQRGDTQPASLTYESAAGPGGMRTRSNSRFVLKYFNNNRDFGQRAEYEGRIVAAMDEAYQTSVQVLGQARQSPVDVVLYTREEFIANFSANTARRVAGLYSMDSIRVNDAAELNPQNRATLVHEYIHAVVDDLAGGQAGRLPNWFNEGLAEYVEWRYLGLDGPSVGLRAALRNEDKAGQLPTLRMMDRGMLINDPDPEASYAFSAMTVQQLLERGGAEKLLQLVRLVGSGTEFREALSQQYGLSLDELQDATRQELSHR